MFENCWPREWMIIRKRSENWRNFWAELTEIRKSTQRRVRRNCWKEGGQWSVRCSGDKVKKAFQMQARGQPCRVLPIGHTKWELRINHWLWQCWRSPLVLKWVISIEGIKVGSGENRGEGICITINVLRVRIDSAHCLILKHSLTSLQIYLLSAPT